MKKRILFGFLITLLIFTSCKRVSKIESEIIGTWQFTDSTNSLNRTITKGEINDMNIEFRSNMTFFWYKKTPSDTVSYGVYEIDKQYNTSLTKHTLLLWHEYDPITNDSGRWTLEWKVNKINSKKLKIMGRNQKSWKSKNELTFELIRI